MLVRMKGLKSYRHPETQRDYTYHRKSGLRIMAEPGTAAFLAEVAAAEASVGVIPEPRVGTLGAAMKRYRASSFFADLKPRTRSDYDKVMNYLSDLDGLPLRRIDGAFIAALRDKVFTLRKRRFANYVLSVLSIVLDHAREAGDISANPVPGVKRIRRPRGMPDRNRPWTLDERSIFMRLAPLQLKLPVGIGRWTGLREGDVLRMPLSAYDGATIRLRTNKRDVDVVIPAAYPLKALIAEWRAFVATLRAEPITLCANSRGKPWTESGFRASLFKFIRRLESEGLVGPGLTFHGLRHTVATELAELGYDDRTIADLLGQDSEEMPRQYSRKARLEKKLKPVVRKLENAHRRRTKLSTNSG